jgi:hypothetical protein
MARFDIKVRTPICPMFTIDWIVAAGAVSTIYAGEPSIKGEATGTSTGAVLPAADGDPLTTSTHQFSGVAKNDSTDTAAAAGAVTTWMPLPGLVYEAKAKTSSTADTAAEVNALKDKRVILDCTTPGSHTAWTVDAAATDANTNAVVILGGDYRTSTVFFMVAPTGTFFTTIAGS